jgi:diacylglycerol kinase family enzyme
MPRAKRRVTLFHNRSAGDADHDERELTELISAAGYAVGYFDVKKCDIARVLAEPADLIAVAGGDGTVRRVALAVRPDGPPLAILPLGTANNLANALGVTATMQGLIAGWRNPALTKFHPMEIEAPWGRQRLIEGIGFGVLARVIDENSGEDIEPLDARRRIAETMRDAEAETFDIRVDGARITEPTVLLEVTTIPLVGPNLLLAPDANPADHLIDLCRVTETDRERAAEWLAAQGDDMPSPLALATASHIVISGRFGRIRLDDTVRAIDDDGIATISLSSATQPLHFVVPGND